MGSSGSDKRDGAVADYYDGFVRETIKVGASIMSAWKPVWDHSILVMLPLLEYVMSIRHRHEQKEITLQYNPVMQRFFIV